MKWLIAHPGPNFSVADVYAGWCEALCAAGQQVARYNLDDRLTFYGRARLPGSDEPALAAEDAYRLAAEGLYADLYRIQPDVLMVVSAFFVPPEILDAARAHGTRVVVVHTESPYEDDRQAAVAAHADVNLINDPISLGRFERAYYVPHAYRPAVHHPGSPRPELVCDLAFVGTGYPSRVAFFERMSLAGLDVLLAGNWQALGEDSPLRAYLAHDRESCLDNADTADVYRSMRAGINTYRRESSPRCDAAGWAMGPREVEMAACGAFFLREPRDEGDEVLPMLPTFATPEEAGALLRWWLAHPDQRDRAASAAREAIADRTFDHHAAHLLRLLGA